MSYQALFYPKSIAIIGASRKIKTVGNDVIKNLVTQGYAGKLYPVNPQADVLYGQKVYSSIAEIPEDIELAIIAIPAQAVLQALDEAHQKGATAAIVISAGFKEAGNQELELAIATLCKEKNITLIGPNCLGVLNPHIKMNASFAGIMPLAGNVAFISQSGALCTAVLDYSAGLHIGFSKFISTGNKAVVDELSLLEYFAQDEQTKVIALYVEQLTNAQALIAVAKKISSGKHAKPIIILKSGATEQGSRAIASHTGSLAGTDSAYDALFAQAGMIRAKNIAQLFDYIQIFSKNELTPVETVTIITNAGGPGVLTTDAVINSGLQLAKLEESTTHKLSEFLPKSANIHNPVDILGDAVGITYQKTLDVLVTDVNTDALIVLLTPQSMTEIRKTASAVVHTHYHGKKPVIASFMGQETVQPGMKIMQEAGVTTTTFPESAAKALAEFAKFAKKTQVEEEQEARSTQDSEFLSYSDVDTQKVRDIFARAKANKQTAFPESEALEIFEAYKFPLLRSGQAKSAAQAQTIAQDILSALGKPTTFALKIISPDILHKSDVGGVVLNVPAEAVAQKSQELIAQVAKNAPDARLEGVLVMQMAPKNGIEAILGVSKAENLGTLIMVGMGGIHVEVLKDVAFGYAPLTKEDSLRMIHSLKLAPLFKGVRGAKASDIEKLVECLGRLSQLVSDFPEITELDCNPVLVLEQGQGVFVLDARIMIEA